MKILGIDTTTKFLCLGLYESGKVYEYNLEVGIKHSALLTVTIKRVLDTLGWRIDDIDYFACGIGPGSFTGIRVGMATLKGLTWSLKKPVLGIPTLDVLARNAITTKEGIIVPMVDAKRNLIYCSAYCRKKGTLKRIMPYMLLNLAQFLKKIKGGNITLLGDGVDLYRQRILKDIGGIVILDKDYWYPKARHIISLALEKIRARKFDSAFNLKAIYLYPKECQIREGKNAKGETAR